MTCKIWYILHNNLVYMQSSRIQMFQKSLYSSFCKYVLCLFLGSWQWNPWSNTSGFSKQYWNLTKKFKHCFSCPWFGFFYWYYLEQFHGQTKLLAPEYWHEPPSWICGKHFNPNKSLSCLVSYFLWLTRNCQRLCRHL